jgi:uncharacterized glyoxalase superfamily protein PhnB
VNLIVRAIAPALEFYCHVLQAQVHYSDDGFAALRILGIELMLHADHTYEHHPWSADLQNGQPRGLGAELRVLGLNPKKVAERACHMNAVFKEISIRGHGWREVMVRDRDGYVWAVGEIHGRTG